MSKEIQRAYLTTSQNGDASAPVNETHAAVAQIWAEVLQRAAIEHTDNFFDLGGDSLKALEVISRVRASLDVELPLIAFFQDPTIAHLAEVINELRQTDGAKVQPSVSAGETSASVQGKMASVWCQVLERESIEITDNFFDLGGDSLKALEVISRLQGELEIELPLIAFFEGPTIAHLANIVEQLAAEKAHSLPAEILPSEAPLSFAQLQYWLLQQNDRLGYLYNEVRIVRIHGEFRGDVLERALNQVARRHQVLATRLEQRLEEPVQLIDRDPRLRVEFEDLCDTPANTREADALILAREEGRRAFNLSTDLPLRARLLRLAHDEHMLVVTVHHVATDGYSSTLLFQELETAYEALSSGTGEALPVLRMQYWEHAASERAQMRGAELEKQLEFWRVQLDGAPRQLDLPSDKRPPTLDHAGKTLRLVLPEATAARLKELGQSNGATVFTVLTAALRVLLHGWAGEQDIVLGTVANNRSGAGTDRMLGCFLNFLPLRNRISPEEDALSLLAREKQIALDAFAHQNCPFVQIAATTARAGERNAVYNVALLLQNLPALHFQGKAFHSEFLDFESDTALLDLRFIARERKGELEIDCEFRSSLFEESTVASLLNGYRGVLEQIIHDPKRCVSKFEIPAELQKQADTARARDRASNIAISSSFTSEPIASPLAFWMRQLGMRAKFEFAPYNQIFQQLLEPQSLISRNREGMNILLLRLTDWLRFEDKLTEAEQKEKIERNLLELADAVKSRPRGAASLLCLCPAESKFARQPHWAEFLDRAEDHLRAALSRSAGVHVVRSKEILDLYPVENYEDPYADQIGHIPYTTDFFAAVATMLARRIFALQSSPKKVIVLDCDNTLWQGVCGENGPTGVVVDPPRRLLQEFMLAQLKTGMLLCLCSKNIEEDVDQVFAQNSGMRLRPEHIAARRINWEPKSANLRALAAELQLGLDSFVLVDDNPIECAEVAAQLPEVLTLTLPKNENQIPAFLRSIWMFDHWSITEEDSRRTAMYQQNTGREQLRKNAATLADFIAGLELEIDIRPVEVADLARVSQLTERTNQFNFTTVRRSEAEVQHFLENRGNCLIVNLCDRFGDYGLVGAILYETKEDALLIDTFLLSCRALGRNLEHHMLARLGEIAQERNLSQVIARFVPSKKNQPAFDFLHKLGVEFRQSGEGFVGYSFPAEYAAKLHLRPETDLPVEEPPAAKTSPPAATNGSAESQNQIVLRIASELFDSRHIARAIESERVMRRQEAAFVAPRTPIEEMVAAAWAQVLTLDRVGIHDNFFALGGHSLAATQVVARVRQTLGAELTLRALFDAPTVAEFATQVDSSLRLTHETQIPPLTPRILTGAAPLSFAQQRLWFLDQLEPGNPIYNVSQMFRMRGRLDVTALAFAINRVIERHDSLRTTFASPNGGPVEVIAPHLRINLPRTDISTLPAEGREAELKKQAVLEARRAFDLTHGPLIRAQVIKLDDQDHALLLTMHHIISDRWSMGVFSEELAAHYAAHLQSKPARVSKLPVQYSDFALWQREWLQGKTLDAQLAYWKKQLSGAPELLQLPTDRPRPAIQSHRGAMCEGRLPRALVTELERLSQSQGTTLFMTLLAGFQVLLSRYSGQDDIVVGSPIANRRYFEIEPLIGFFVNTLCLRGDLSGNPSFAELLSRTRDTALGAYTHQDIPFEKLVEELQPQRSLSHNPIFQVMFAHQTAPMQALQLPGFELERVPVHTGTALFDMAWFAINVPDGLLMRVEYATDLFDHATVARALRHFERLLESSVSGPDCRISQLQILDKEERHKVLVEFNDTAAQFPPLCIHNFLEQTAERAPGRTALICGEERTTYRELNQRANQIAHHLINLGARPDDLVAVYMERTRDLIPAIFGVLKSGAAYVPLDPSYPQERLVSILDDSGARIVVTERSLRGQLPKENVQFLCVDSDWETIARESKENPRTAVTGDNLAYVLFTSGSTGRPKGVALEHRNNVTFVRWAQTVFTPDELAGVIFCSSIGFDMSTFEMFLTTAAGGKIILAENPLYLPALPAKDEITLINTVPSAIAELVRMNLLPPALTTVVLAGEALPEPLLEEIYRTGTVNKVYNLYGPTESGYSTGTLVPRCQRVTIGKPIANEQAYVLDRECNPVPIGVPGELYLAGEGLARGYFGRTDLTAERFIPDPFTTQKNARMYKTGDLCRWLRDGNLDYLGRVDHQVKLRGFRIELGEIESVLTEHSSVRQCLLLAREDQPGTKRLVAYVVPREGVEINDDVLVAHLEKSLPGYMIPSAFVVLDGFPLTSNGKIDRKALPAPEYKQARGARYIPPCSAVEEKIAAIWGELLHVSRVSADADFFGLGGHSLLATQVISRLQQAFEVELPLKAMFESPVLEVLAARIQAAKHGSEVPLMVRVSRERPVPASFAQQRMWFLDQLEPGKPTFNIAYTMKITGRVNVDAIAEGLNIVAARQESLRTSFAPANDAPLQVIHESVRLPLRRVDLTTVDPNLRESEARRLIAEDANEPFDLSQAPLARALYLKIGEEDHYLCINIHHIISDRWSMSVLIQELASAYEAVVEGKAQDLPLLPLQYADYSVWQHAWLRGEALEKQLAYWKHQLKDAPPVLELPTDRPRQATERFRGDVAYLTLTNDLRNKLNQLCRRQGATLFMTLLAGFQALLARHSGQDDVVIGTGIANRTHPDLEKIVGCFLNTLVLRARLHDDPSFSELVARAREAALGAYAHQDMPFEKLVEELNPERNLSHSPLVQIYFVLQNAPTETLEIKGLAWKHVPSGIQTVKGDLYLSMQESHDGLEARLEYSTDLFDRPTAERLLEHYRVLLEAAVANPDLKISELPLLTEGERKRVVEEWNASAADYPRQACLYELIEQQAARIPEAIACLQPGESAGQDRALSYSELNAQANQLARALRQRGAGPGVRVGVCVERTLEMMVALLAVQKSGAAYVPLDPGYPAERIRLILEDAEPKVLVTQSSLTSLVPETGADLLLLDCEWSTIAQESTANLNKTATANDLVYVIFTSGSTGRPKGVEIRHGAVVNLLRFMAGELRMGKDDVFPALASFAFDMCIPELYLALTTGGRVVIGNKNLAANGEELAALLKRTGATVVHATPTTWRLLLEAGFTGQGLKRVIGAEPLSRELCRRLLEADGSLYNFYGPTETTVWSTWHHFCSPDEPVVVGRPIANTQVYILDQQRQPVPMGVYGEIYIAGDGIAQGYLRRPELTAEKFVRNRFSTELSSKMYRTGDMARYLPDGRIEFQGRADHQVKVRGYRIELGEIESAISQHSSVQECVVMVREDVPGDKRLVAYVIAAAGSAANVSELRRWLKQRLPEYMVPAAVVALEAFPLTPNGKVDRKALLAPEYTRPELETGYQAARTPTEEILATIWSGVMKLTEVGVHDNFFELGGHSLLATQVMARIREVFQIELPLRALFEAPTIAGLGEKVTALKSSVHGLEAPALTRVPRNQTLPLSFAQQRLWFLDQLEPGNPLYNVAYVTRLHGQLNIGCLERSLNQVIARHESLRTTFPSINDHPVQVIAPSWYLKIEVADVSDQPSLDAREKGARRLATEEMQCCFDLTRGPLLRALVIKIGQDDHALVLNTHHIISDRWSLAVLLEEVRSCYEASLAGRAAVLPRLEVQYADFAVWQREFLSGEVLNRQLAYWRQQLTGAPAVLELPTDRPRQGTQQFWGAMHRQPLPTELVGQVRSFSLAQRATFFMTLLAAFNLLLRWQVGRDDIVVGTDFANRRQLETEKLIGFFVNLLPMRARIDPSATCAEFLDQVRETALGAIAHQDVPFDKLVEELRPERSLMHNPLVQVLFVFQNTPRMLTEIAGLKLSPLGVGSSSRFDLVLFINDPETEPWAMWTYNPKLFEAGTIARMAARYELVLKMLCAQPAGQLQTCFDALDEAEKQQRSGEQQKLQQVGLDKLKKAKRKVIAEV